MLRRAEGGLGADRTKVGATQKATGKRLGPQEPGSQSDSARWVLAASIPVEHQQSPRGGRYFRDDV